MPNPEFPTYSHTKKTTGIGFPGESPIIGGNVSNENPQGSVTLIDWIPTNTGMAFTGNVAIGTETPSSQYKFSVIGNSSVSSAATFGQNVYVVGILTALKFFGDGSGLTNITGIGAGIQLKNNGTLVGSSGTVDFFGNVTVSIGAGSGIATVSIANYWANTSVGVNTLANVGIGTTNPTSLLTVGGNVSISGVTTFNGITTVTGTTLFAKQLNVSGVTTFNGIATATQSLFANNLSVSGIITDGKGDVRQIPRSTNITVVSSDAGKFLDVSAGVTINSSTAFNIGDAVTIFNNGSASITITATGVTLRQAGTSNTGSRTLGAYALVTVLCVASNTYVVGGAGLT
jgi:hypothetical protein